MRAPFIDPLARVESLKSEKRNAMAREKRAKNTVHSLQEHLRGMTLITVNLKDKIDSAQSHKYTKEHREFAVSTFTLPNNYLGKFGFRFIVFKTPNHKHCLPWRALQAAHL